MDKLLRGLSFVTIYLDDILIHSSSLHLHKIHFREVLDRFASVGLTLRGQKCHIGKTSVAYLGHVFTGVEMAPDPDKVKAVKRDKWNGRSICHLFCMFIKLVNMSTGYSPFMLMFGQQPNIQDITYKT